MEQKQPAEARFALLIDADNVSSKYIRPIMDELSKYGTVTYKRIYGDWTSTLHAKWKDTLLDNSLTPIQQFSYTQGKNATDSAMIIDAMDILYTNSVEGFCIVSSDSDFTRLASRIRESGLTVIGMGEKKTPTPFRKACDIFTTLELLVRADRDRANGGHTTPKADIEKAVVNIITDNQNNGKSTGLGEVGSRLLKQYPDFDVRSYGTNLLSKLLDEFESVEITRDGSNIAVALAEGASHAAAAEDAPDGTDAAEPEPAAPKRRRRKTKVITADGVQDRLSTDEAAPESGAGENVAETSAEAGSAVEGEMPAPAKPCRTRRRRAAKAAEGADAVASDEAREGAETVEGAQGEDLPAASEDGAAPKPAAEGGAPADEQLEPAPKRRRSRSRKSARETAGEPAEQAVPTAAPEEQAVAEPSESAGDEQLEPASAPKRRRSRSRKAAAQVAAPSEAVEEPAAPVAPTADENEPASEPAAEPFDSEPAPKRRRSRSRRAPAKEAASAAPAEAPAPAASAVDADAVAAFVRDEIRASGAAGADLAALAKQVRARFRGFKVRDLGFTQFKSYVASLGDIAVEKQGADVVARLAE